MKKRIVGCILTTICIMAAPNYAQQASNNGETPAPSNTADWAGLWVAERSFGPGLKGPVTLHKSSEGWTARIQGESVPVELSTEENGKRSWTFSVLGQGYFIGHQTAAGEAIIGHWFQPPGTVQNYPFASPVHLTPAGSNGFTGTIRPFPQTLSLNIPLIADGNESDDGPTQYSTFLRNPERNLGVFFRIESATLEGDEIQFKNADGDLRFTGHSVVPGERFSLQLRSWSDVFDFTRRSRQEAPGFYPRRSTEPPTTMLRPAELGDGWLTASPADAGLDAELLADLIGEIVASEPTELRQSYIHSILIAHRGKLVMEEYFHGFHSDIPHDSRSAGKTIASVLLGIAIHKGVLASVDEPVYPLFGGVDAFANPDPRKDRMTARHLISMSSGLNCDDDDYDNPGNEDTMQSQTDQPNWYKYILDLAMVREPGEAGVYCTSGISLPHFFEETIAGPLDISHYHMNLSPTYDGYMGGGIRLRPRDFLKIGQLYLDGGVWKGKRIVSKDWVQKSAESHASLNRSDDYGFAWWRSIYEINGRQIETYSAAGNGGQNLFVVPELDITVMINAGNYSDGRTVVQFRDRFMQEFILPATLKSK